MQLTRYLNIIMAPFIGIPMFYCKYLEMHKPQIDRGTKSKLLYGGDNRLARARGLSFRTDAQTIQ